MQIKNCFPIPLRGPNKHWWCIIHASITRRPPPRDTHSLTFVLWHARVYLDILAHTRLEDGGNVQSIIDKWRIKISGVCFRSSLVGRILHIPSSGTVSASSSRSRARNVSICQLIQLKRRLKIRNKKHSHSGKTQWTTITFVSVGSVEKV